MSNMLSNGQGLCDAHEFEKQKFNIAMQQNRSTEAENLHVSVGIVKPMLGVVLIDFPKNGWCHLVADSIQNLHSFAQSIGLNKCWFQNKRKKNQPHYDVKGAMIDKAIKAGATQVDSRTIVDFLRQHYA